MSRGPRYAIYYAPRRESAWWRFGAGWLGRDECAGAALERLPPPGMDAAAFDALTAAPRRYGFHATLKAPFRLAAGADEALLRRRLAALATQLAAVPLLPLVPIYMDGFVALVPAQRHPGLEALAARCVTELDDLRAPLEADDLARRNPDALDVRGRELLDRHGYPHVLERFRFHLTLSGTVNTAIAGTLVARVAPEVARLNTADPPRLDRLCLFVEPEPGAPFLRIHEEALP